MGGNWHNMNNVEFLTESFKKYYFDNINSIHVLPDSSKREFGYQKFGSGMIRHLEVKNDNDLRVFLMQNNPADVYCSNAYYSFPTADMKDKDFQGADLIFDIDAKDLNLPCRRQHTCAICQDCKHVYQDELVCTECKSAKSSTISIACKDCIYAAKDETRKLLNLLHNDLGIDRKDIQVYFSGNEGFHVHAYDVSYKKMESKERGDLVDYIMFRGFTPDSFGFKKSNPKKSNFPDPGEKDWSERVAKYLFSSKKEKSKISKQLIKDGYNSLQKKFDYLTHEIGIKIDANVTSDIHRIFRFPNSLNSKSGLVKSRCDDLINFDPYKDACLINDDKVSVRANCPISFKLNGKTFGPYKQQIIDIPRYAAVYLICKDLGTINN